MGFRVVTRRAIRSRIFSAFGCCDARGGERLELVRVQMQRLADQEGGLGNRIGGAMRKHQLGLGEAADGIADEIEQRQQFAGADLGEFRWASAALRRRFCAFGHQGLVQRAAAASSWSRASTQLVPFSLSSRFQNGALVLR